MTHENIKYVIVSFILFFSLSVSTVFWLYVTNASDSSIAHNIKTTGEFVHEHVVHTVEEVRNHYMAEAGFILSDNDVTRHAVSGDRIRLLDAVNRHIEYLKARDSALVGVHVVFTDDASSATLYTAKELTGHALEHGTLAQKSEGAVGFKIEEEGLHFVVTMPAMGAENKPFGTLELIVDVSAFVEKLNDGHGHHSALLLDPGKRPPFLYESRRSADGYSIYLPGSDLFGRFLKGVKIAEISEERLFADGSSHYAMTTVAPDGSDGRVKIAVLYDVSPFVAEKEAFVRNFTLFTLFAVVSLSIAIYFIILYFVRIIQEKEKQTVENANRIYKLSRTNQVSGLPNSIEFFEDIKGRGDFSAIVLDVESFSIYNTFYGMAFSDALLQCSAAYLLNNIPGNGKLYHINMDKFAIILKEPAGKQEFLLIKQIKSYFEQRTIVLEGIEIPASFAFGIVLHADEDCLLKGNVAIRDSMRRGKGQVTYFHENLLEDTNYVRLAGQMVELRRHLDEDNIVPFYQPIVDLSNDRVVKYECLARIDDNGAFKTPDEFIEAGEESGLISAITKTMINKAFEHCRGNRAAISINVTKQDLIERYLPEFLATKAKRYGIDYRNITLEILENIAAEEDPIIAEQIRKIEEEGFVIAIDDFGRGHSSFSRFMELNVNFIKIDGLFIKDIDTDDKSLKIVKSIVQMANNLGIKTVAEYVHSAEIARIVREAGVDYAQGYYYSRPVQTI